MIENIQNETSAGGIVFKKRDGIFLWLIIQHSKAKHWGFPKGHVGDKIPNEKYEDAALREVKEEGGISARILSHDSIEINYSYNVDTQVHHKTVYYFLMEYITGDTAEHDMEVQEAMFVPDHVVIEMLTYPSDMQAFMKAKELLGK